MAKRYAIETVNLSKSFAIKKQEILVLSNINIRLKYGELAALCGPNGSGKTTLLKILATLILPTFGKAFVNGFDTAGNSKAVRKSIGFVDSESRSFYWRLNGYENLKFFAALYNLSNNIIEKRVKYLIDYFEKMKNI